jgi:hypothetical protein
MSKLQEIRARQALEEVGLSSKVRIEHSPNPKTYIGYHCFNLVFPNFITKYKTDVKDIYISFEGLATNKRQHFLDNIYDLYNEQGVIMFYPSDRGRQLSTREKDDSYFQTMARSKFVACPDGDFIWTYRFFEAILCGAIPIIENDCPLYEGYKFYTIGQKLTYREDWVKHNLNKIKKEMMLQ